MHLIKRVQNRIEREINLFVNHRQVRKITASLPSPLGGNSKKPVIFYNASTRLSGLSQNAGFSLVTSLALRSQGIPVVHFVCHRGLSHCVLGIDRHRPQTPPPCVECMRTSRLIFDGAVFEPYGLDRDEALEREITNLKLDELLDFEYQGFPVGSLILPSLRWILRRHHLFDDENTRYLAREYVLSAWNIKSKFECVLEKYNPMAVVVFNGMFYPEAAARWIARKKKIPVYSHEVGMLPLSAFFTEKEATAYPVDIDRGFQLSDSQNSRLDAVIEKRSKGMFVTAGIRFWSEMNKLDESFKKRAKKFQAVVPVFTNVVFDTSQGHANVIFDQMFAWLDVVLDAIKKHPQTLFVIRAHPDELRLGKESRETVADWVRQHAVDGLDNVIFISPDEFISSYELINQAKFVMVYNSTIGLEASVMGKPVLCAGKARYTQIPTVFFPISREIYSNQLHEFLTASEIKIPDGLIENARRVFYSQLFRASLPFDEFLEEDGVWRGYVRLKHLKIGDLSPDHSEVMRVIQEGIIREKPFIRKI